jgi:ribosomal protein L39E
MPHTPRVSILHNPPLTLDAAQQLAADLARNRHIPAHVVLDTYGYIICDDEDVRVWRLDQVVWSCEPEAVYQLAPACITCGDDGDCPDCEVAVCA